MLVLSRKKDETIVIGEGDSKVEITIVDIRGDKVRLGITAPRSISVHRKEIYDAIQKEKKDNDKQMDDAIQKMDDANQEAMNVAMQEEIEFAHEKTKSKNKVSKGHNLISEDIPED